MNWRDYEKEVFAAFKRAYPDSEIKFDVSIEGRYSREPRQVDLLIEGRIAGKKIRIVVDGKHYKRNVNVKHVETFISMLEDVEADQGILVTSKGYSKAAMNRAYHGPKRIELDILSFDELRQFQGDIGFPYSGRHGAMLPAPFGWVVDGEPRSMALATLYQRGSTLKKAQKAEEWMYFKISKYDSEWPDLETVLSIHERETKEFHPGATFKYDDSVKRKDGAKTLIRTILRKETPLHEYTGFIDFKEFCVFSVLFTPKELHVKNIRKLEYVLENLVPAKVDLEALAKTEIAKRRKELDKAVKARDKAEILISIGNIYKDIGDTENALKMFYDSVELLSENYGARLAILKLKYNSDEKEAVLKSFFALGPSERQLYVDIVQIGFVHDDVEFIIDFFKRQLETHATSPDISGNIYFALGEIYYSKEDYSSSIKYFQKSQSQFESCVVAPQEALNATAEVIEDLKRLQE